MKYVVCFGALCALLLFASNLEAEIPKLINYQGMLTGDTGEPLDGTFDTFFRIYNAPSGGSLRWEENHAALSVSQGLFNAILGSQSGGINLDFSEEYWLEVVVEGEVMPRVRFTSVGYAYRALVADTASIAAATTTAGGWTDDGSVVRLTTSTDKVGIGTSTPGAELEVFSPDQVDLWLNRGGMAWAAALNFRRGGGLDWSILTPSGDTSLLILNRSYQTVQSFLQNGNVGIGTEDPSSKLDVDGDINTSSSYRIYGTKVLSAPNQNLFVGLAAGYSNTTGGHNTIVGTNAGDNNTTGSDNIFVGNYAGRFNTTGNGNIAIGKDASYWDSSGSFNTILGYQAGHNNHTGSYNVFLGHKAGYGEAGSNKLYIANSDADPPLIYGDFLAGSVGVGTTNPGQKLDVDLGNIVVQGTGSFDANGEEGVVYLGSVHHYVKGVYGFGVKIGTYAAGDAISIKEISGNVGIGTIDPDYKLDVNGDINVSGSYNVKKNGANYNHPDYVFEDAYELMPLGELKEYVRKNKSLPNVISAEEVMENEGFKMDELLIQMLEKIEEQTLYIFELEERIARLEEEGQ